MNRIFTSFLIVFMLHAFPVGAQNIVCLNLYSTGTSSDGFINLEWQWLTPPTQTYGYTLCQWDNALKIWQSTSTNCDKAINILNVYPDIPESNTLASWMHDPAVGLGKISVTPMSITSFNSNPDYYLKNASGQYQYDVIMFGSWDRNNNKDLTNGSAESVRNFLNSGRGVLFGHDTQVLFGPEPYWINNPIFCTLSDKTNLYIPTYNANLARGSIRIEVVNNGFLLRYPHHIPYGSVLNIPFAHSSVQYARGVVWMSYPEPLEGMFTGPVIIQNGGTNDFYLTTWNNAALIQTGHSNGESTIGEREIIANTLWYLAQFTTDRNTRVCSAPDIDAPDRPTVKRQTTTCSKIDITSKDNGTLYKFYVKAINMVDYSDTCKSNIIELVNKSGLKGFHILENNNPVSVPDISSAPFFAAKDNQLLIYTIQVMSRYVHIQAVDSAGNLSAVFTLNPLEPYKVTATVVPAGTGTVAGTGTFNCDETATLTAVPETGYSFLNWTENSNLLPTSSSYSFTVINDRSLTANFRIIHPDSLDFDTYAVIICNRVILLNLKKLADDGFEVTGCKWYKNGKEVKETHTINAFSYSEGPDKELETAPNYYSYRLVTNNFGELPSTEKIIIHPDKAPKCPETETYNPLIVYPNPITKGSLLTLEGLIPEKKVYVYNHIGEIVLSFTATESSMKLTFDFPQGIYLVRTEGKIVKVVVK